jgi:2-polyprenyl-3-methyl-5-hydroxy-6-metoxy-1,4-benzoquinol methylase
MIKLFKTSSPKKEIEKQEPLTEEQYYKKLFVENPRWNKPTANAEEEKRWIIIDNFIYFIKGMRKASGKVEALNILDLGCGRGWLTNMLLKHGKATGIEPIQAVVEHGRKMFPHLDLKIGSTTELLHENYQGKFDVIVCAEVIEHVADEYKKQFVHNINSLLSPNGFAIITTPRKDVQEEWLKHVNPDQPIEEWIDEATLKQYFHDEGFIDHLLERFGIKPNKHMDEMDIYQLWLFQKLQ